MGGRITCDCLFKDEEEKKMEQDLLIKRLILSMIIGLVAGTLSGQTINQEMARSLVRIFCALRLVTKCSFCSLSIDPEVNL